MQEVQEQSFLEQSLISIVSFFLGLFLFLSSFLFLYQNEATKSHLSKKDMIHISQQNDIFSQSKKVTYQFKNLFIDEKKSDFFTATWFLRGIGFFIMWFGFTLFLVSWKPATNRLGIFSLIFSFVCFCIYIIFINILFFFIQAGEKTQALGDTAGGLFSGIFGNSFWNSLFGIEFDIYFLYFLLFLLFLILYFFFPRIKEKIKSKLPEKKKKSSFKKYEK